MIELYIMNNFPFGGMSKFETKFELENLEVKLLLNLGQIYWGVQTCLDKFDNFPKIAICLGLQECEFRMAWWYGKF
jgi:hypothetical protein